MAKIVYTHGRSYEKPDINITFTAFADLFHRMYKVHFYMNLTVTDT